MTQSVWPADAPPPPPGPVRAPLETGPLEFQEILRRSPRNGVWWSLLGLLAVGLGVLVASAAAIVPFAVVLAAKGVPADRIQDELSGVGTSTPSFLAVVNLGWALAILTTWLALLVVHGLKPRWLESVRPRLRWRWLGVCLGLALVALVATVAVSALLPTTDDGSGSLGHGLNDVTATTLQFLVVILLLTPLQAAGEEHVFRGYLMQAVGSVFGDRRTNRVVAVVVSGLVFSLAHGAQQGLEIFVDRFAFGAAAAVLVVVTGGLEAGIAMHVLNNFAAFGLALFVGDMTEALHATGGSWWGLVGTAVQIGVWLGLTIPVARRMGVRSRTEPTTVLAR